MMPCCPRMPFHQALAVCTPAASPAASLTKDRSQRSVVIFIAQVRLDEMEEHMRISLLDPKWKEQKQRDEERRKV